MKNIRYVFGSFFPDSLLTLPMPSRGGIYECNKGSVVKKTLTSIMAVATMLNLCSCSQEFIDTPESKKAIVFNDVQTREAVSSADDIRCMGVFAQMNLGDIDKSETGSNSYIMLLENERVSRDYPSAPWTYEHTRYWVADRKYHFFAVWPYSGDNSSVTNVKSVVGSGAYSYSLTFETPEKADQDLLTAVSGAITTKTGVAFPEAVGLNFQRELSNVNLKIWSNGAPDNVQDKIKVKEVTISSVTQTGTLTKTVGNDSSWKHSSTKTSFTKNYGDDGITVSQAQIIDGVLVPNPVSEYNKYDDEPGIPFGDGLLLIPHTISNSAPVIVTVIYDLQRPTDAEEDLWETKKLQAFLPEGTWPAGKKLTYNLVISGERTITEFQINTVVEDWITQTDEIDFTQGVTVTDKMNWVEGTYQSWNREKGEVVLYTDEEKVAVCEFNISTPIGATWTASLIPLTASAMDAFSIVEDSKYGDVGTDVMQKVKIKINSTAPIAARAECLLRITVLTSDGRTIVVKDLMPAETETGIEEFKIIKNVNVQRAMVLQRLVRRNPQ